MSNIAQLGFESLNPNFKIDKPVRLIELFARQQVDGWDCWGNEV